MGPGGHHGEDIEGAVHSAGLFSLGTISFWDDGSTIRSGFGTSFYYRYNYILNDMFKLYSGIGSVSVRESGFKAATKTLYLHKLQYRYESSSRWCHGSGGHKNAPGAGGKEFPGG